MARFFESHSGARWRLVLLGLMVPLVVASVVSIWQDYQSRREAIITQVGLKSAQVNAQLEDFVHTVRGASGTFAVAWSHEHSRPPTGTEETEAQAAHLAGFVADRPHFSHAYITDTTGTILVSSGSGVGARLGPASIYERALSTGAFTSSDVVTPEGEEAPFALFVTPLASSGSGFEGFLVLRSELARISGVLDMSFGFPASAKSGIFDSQGRILAGTGYEAPHPGMAAGRDVSASAVWAQAATGPTEAWFGPGLDKVQRIIFFGYPDTTPWVTTVAFAQSELFDPLWRRLWSLAAVLLVTVVAVVWVAEIWVRRERESVAVLEKERLALNAVMNGATDGMLVVDVDGTVSFVNRRFSGMFRLPPSETVGQSSEAVLARIAAQGDEVEDTWEQLRDALLSSETLVVDSVSMRDTLGLELEMTFYPHRTEAGDHLGRTIVFHDVTRAKAVQRMKSDFLATASHQLRTPMASILAFSELSLTREAAPQKQRAWLEGIRSQSNRMTATINSMLDVSQIESGRLDLQLEDVDVAEVCREVADAFDVTARRHRFEISVPEDVGTIWADRERFVQTLENLVDNAAKYTPGEGVITIAADRRPDGTARFRVSDTGVGIGPEDLGGLFVPFSRASSGSRALDVPGTGLGLYIARSLCEMHGGAMWVESSRGAGTTVSFTMPPPPAVRAADAQEAASGLPFETERRTAVRSLSFAG